MAKKRVDIYNFAGLSFISFCILSFVMHGIAHSAVYATNATMTGYSSTLPASADIEDPAQKAVQAADAFMQESIEARLAYECSGRFPSQAQQENLHSLTKTSVEQLETIINSQRLLKKQLEDYEGDDWDERYGESGLWRKLDADLERSILLTCEVNYFKALSATENKKRLVLYDALNKLALLSDGCRNADCTLLKAKIFTALSLENNDYKRLARNQLDLILAEPDIEKKTYFKAAVAKIKLTGQSKPGQLEEIAAKLAGSNYKDDFELNMPMAFLQRQFGSVEGLERVAKKWPEVRAFMGRIILQDLQSPQLERLSIIEAELATEAAWQSGPAQYAGLLNAMAARPELQTPLVLYVAAAVQAESSPVEAIEMLMRASQARQLKGSNGFSIPAEKIAGQAAELACQLFMREPNCCGLTRRAIANYITLAKGKPEQKIEYLYSVVLNNCGRAGEGKELLRKIADGKGRYRYKAKYELIALEAQEQRYNEPQHRADLIRQLKDLIAAVGEADEFDREVRNNARLLYCQLLVSQKDKASAEQALDVIAELETPAGQELSRLNSQALQQAGRLNEALQVLIGVVDPNDCTDALPGLELLLKIFEKIDEYELQAPQGQADDFDSFLGQCCSLAEYCFRCVPSSAKREATVVLAELLIFTANEEEKLLEADRLLAGQMKTTDKQDVDLLRCQARLLMAHKRYNEAAELWSQICRIRKALEPWVAAPPQDALRRGRPWWRAKFYQLDCQSRVPGSSRQDILHGLDVLGASFGEIPEPWAERLSKLKKTLQ